MFRWHNKIETEKLIRNPEKLIWAVVRKNFPFLLIMIEKDPSWVDDINQSAWLAFYATGGNDFRGFWNYCQRELYALAKAAGYRRKKKNEWFYKEGKNKNPGFKPGNFRDLS